MSRLVHRSAYHSLSLLEVLVLQDASHDLEKETMTLDLSVVTLATCLVLLVDQGNDVREE